LLAIHSTITKLHAVFALTSNNFKICYRFQGRSRDGNAR